MMTLKVPARDLKFYSVVLHRGMLLPPGEFGNIGSAFRLP